MNLGNDEILECYIGSDAITEAYLGEDLVFSSGPFQGLKLSPKELKFRNTTIATGDTKSFYVKSSEDWTISTDADWFTLSPASGIGNSQKTEVTLTVISIPSAETTNTVTCTSANYSASAGTLYKVGYGIPENEIWYATNDNSSITTINRWKVYDKNGVQMTSADFSTYGKMVFPRAIGYVAGDPYISSYNWDKLTEIGFPEMEPSLCTGANDFGMRYFPARLQYWTRIYGDYPYISADETHMWGSDGTGGAYVRGKTGTLTIAEGVKTLGPYALNYASFESVIFPTTFTGMTGYNDGYAISQYAMEDMSSLTSIKYQTPALPRIQSGNAFSRINSPGKVLYPCGGTGYEGNFKPINFTWEAYGC